MTFLIDTSVLFLLLKDRDGKASKAYQDIVTDEPVTLCRLTQMEMLRGVKDEQEWSKLERFLAKQSYIEIQENTWVEAGRIYFDLRRRGLTIRNSIDCCIAQIALDADCTLLHNDRDFRVIAQIRPLREIGFMI